MATPITLTDRDIERFDAKQTSQGMKVLTDEDIGQFDLQQKSLSIQKPPVLTDEDIIKFDRPQGWIAKGLEETGRQLQDLMSIPGRTIGIRQPWVSKLATETIPYLAQKAVTPIAEFQMKAFSAEDIKHNLLELGKVIKGQKPQFTHNVSEVTPTPLDVAILAYISLSGVRSTVARTQWNMQLNKAIQTEKTRGAVMNNIPAFEKILEQGGIKLPPGLRVDDKAAIVLSQARKSPTLGSAIIKLSKGQIISKEPIKNVVDIFTVPPKAPVVKPTVTPAPKPPKGALPKIVPPTQPKFLKPLTDAEIDQKLLEKAVLDDYMKAEVGKGNLYSIVKSEGGIAPYKKGMPGAIREEYREDVPVFLRNRQGKPLDQMAEALKNRYPQFGIETESDLLEALVGEKSIAYAYAGVPLTPEMKLPNLGIMNKLASKFDVEYPFQKMGKPKTGLALKNYFAKIDVEQKKGLEVIKNLNQVKLTDKEYQDLTFIAYQPGKFVTLPPEQRKRISPAYQTVKQYFKLSEVELKEAEIISEGFPQSMVKRLTEENIHLRTILKKKISLERRTKIMEQVKGNQQTIDFIKKARIQYVPISMRLWFKDLLEKQPTKIPRLINQFFKTRKIVDLKGFSDYLLEQDIITPADLDIRRILGSYAHQKGLKLAMGKIVNTAIEEGVLKPIDQAPEDWIALPSRLAPGLKGHKGHPAFIDYLEDNFMRFKGLPPEISRPLAYIKMMQFYNPLFLPAYDMYQAAWLGSLRDIKAPINFIKSAHSIKTKDKFYLEAMENGTFSQPFMAPWDEYMKNVDREIASLSSPKKKFITDFTAKLEKQKILGLTDAIYRLSWNTAWTLDKFVRMTSYHHLLDNGFTSQEAAQLVAKFHGDYASLPPATKRAMNRIFFTPTFKIVMGKLQFNMAENAGKAILGGKMSKSDKRMAQGLIALLAIIFARKMLFRKWGFKEDTLGYRYTKTIITPEGEEKELVISVPTPDNILMRYWNKLKRIPQTDDKLEKILAAIPFNLHPLWDYGRSMIGNRKPDGRPIYNPFDDADKITKDISIFTLNRIVRVTEVVKALSREERTEGIKAMEQDLGSITKVLQWFAFPYVRNVKIRRTSYKIFRLQQDFKRLFRIDPAKTPEEEDARLDNFIEKLEKLHLELED